MYKIHIPQFNDDIYITESWVTEGMLTGSGDAVYGEAPVPFNAYAQVLPHRGTSDYNSGWQPFLQVSDAGTKFYYRIIYTAATDTGSFDIAYESNGSYNGLSMPFNFTAGVDNENKKYLMFTLRRPAFIQSDTFNQPGNYTLWVMQWETEGFIGTWGTTQYNYTSNGVHYTPLEFYNGAGPWIPVFPQTQQTAWTREVLPGIIARSYTDPILYNIPSTSTPDYGVNINFNSAWTPAQIKNTSGDPADPGEYDPNSGGGTSHPGGGDGDHQGKYDPINIPPIPTIGPYSAGFIYMLNMDVGQMQQFASDIVKPSMWQAFKSMFADPLDFMCGVMLVPYLPGVGSAVYPMYGENVFDHAYNLVSNQYTEIDCGSIFVNKYYGSCFDHNPYQKLLLWLPYIGYRELDPDEFNGKYIHVVYHCDCMSGDCVAFIKSETGGMGPTFGRVVAQFSGSCGVRVPYGRTSYDSMVQASIQLLGGAVGTALGGAMGGMAGLAAGNISAGQIANSIQGSTIMAVNGAKTGTERSGTAGASAGYLSIQKPYLLRTLPQQSLPDNYVSVEGYPSNMPGPLNQYSGFAAVETIKLSGISATDAEKSEIQSLLTGGVYI